MINTDSQLMVIQHFCLFSLWLFQAEVFAFLKYNFFMAVKKYK